MKRPIPEGLLIAIEGIDGAGKTSVATALTQWCGERGIACHMSKEPTGVFVGEKLRRSAQFGRLSLEDELDLFILDRKEHVKRTIAPALAESSIVILDRYYWSTAAYQGARGADPAKIVADNEEFAPKPDIVLLLDLPVSVGRERIGRRGDVPNEFEQTHSLELARNIFLQLAKTEDNVQVINSDRPMRDVISDAVKSFQLAAVEKIVSSAKAKYGMVTPEQLNEVLAWFGAPPLGGSEELVPA